MLKTLPLLSRYLVTPLDAGGRWIQFCRTWGWRYWGGLAVKKEIKIKNNFEEDSSGLKDGKAGIFGSSSFS